MSTQTMDAGAATIAIDRCRPPQSLTAAPATIKAVLWCIRGLGAPGTDLAGCFELIEERTCLSASSVRRAIAALREVGILNQTQLPAPGKPASFRLDYDRLADWLSEDDRDLYERTCQRRSGRLANAGQPDRRTPVSVTAVEGNASQPDTHRQSHRPPTPVTVTGVHKEIAPAFLQRPAEDLQQQQQEPDAAAAAGVSVGEWEDMAKAAGLDQALAAQCADVLRRRGWTNRETARIALERLAERRVGETLRNPTGLFVTLLSTPGGPEPSKAAITRARAEDGRRRAHLAGMSPEQRVKLARRLAEEFPGNPVASEQCLSPDLAQANAVGKQARAKLWELWHQLKHPAEQEAACA